MKRHHWIALGLLVLAIMALIWPALYNGYPLVYSDSGTYLNSGFKDVLPIDRPVTYGYLVRHISMEHSLWFVILVQAILVWLYSGYFLSTWFKRPFNLASLLLIPLALLTGLSNFTSQIMADLFAGLVLLGFVALILRNRFKWYDYLFLFFTSYLISTHMAYVALVMGLTLIVLVMVLLKWLPWKALLRSVSMAGLPVLLLMFIQWSYTDQWRLSSTGNVFIFGRTLESGVMQKYLQENCEEKGYFFCERVDEMPLHTHELLWQLESPLYDSLCMSRGGWSNCWVEHNDELGRAVNDLFKDGSHRMELLSFYGREWINQLLDFELGHLNPEREGSSVVYAMELRINRELEAYQAGRQYAEVQTFKTVSRIQFVVVILSLAMLLMLLVRGSYSLPKTLRIAMLLVLVGLLGNALVTDLFATTLNRYMARIIWLIPFMAAIILSNQPWFQKKRDSVKFL